MLHLILHLLYLFLLLFSPKNYFEKALNFVLITVFEYEHKDIIKLAIR